MLPDDDGEAAALEGEAVSETVWAALSEAKDTEETAGALLLTGGSDEASGIAADGSEDRSEGPTCAGNGNPPTKRLSPDEVVFTCQTHARPAASAAARIDMKRNL